MFASSDEEDAKTNGTDDLEVMDSSQYDVSFEHFG